jgi:CelD/BcsL family acetyltransferase involved in cellulose biosynthesis
MTEVQLITSSDEFEKLKSSWDAVLSRSLSNNFFLSWDWLWNWWHVYSKPTDKLAIFLLRQGQGIIGIGPFYIRKKYLGGIVPAKKLMFLGTQEEDEGDVGSDYMDIFCREGEEYYFVKKIIHYIAQYDLCDELSLSRMDVDSITVPLLQKEAKQSSLLIRYDGECESPYIMLPKTWEDYLNSLSASLRYKIRSERRKLEKLFTIEYKRVQNEADTKYGFAELVRLHQARWESRGFSGSFSNENFLEFHRRLAPSLVQKGVLQLTLLSENKNTRAAIYNYYHKNKIYFYQSGVDIAAGAPAFGYLLHCHCIENAIRNGYREYDFLPRGRTDEYKDRFANASRRIFNIHITRSKFLKYYVIAKESALHIYRRMKIKKT